ncbi:cell division protein FtsQ/DivIB [Streptosporangium roseum]|uniref:cell division protein FtsQ/DivIB n=1 Tax=Streptosporangium roseum TaxID=2001 RepID=UPI0004CD995B|nr:FtsQ-type POTRA domain-containing protein [Streptosporangium roseum]
MNGVWRSAFLALLTVGVVGTAAWLVFFSSVLGVRDIRVVGNLGIPAQQIQQATGVPEGRPLAVVDVEAVEQRIGGIRQIESVRVSRGWPGTLVVEIVEREPVAVVAVGGRFALMDRHGVMTEIKDVAPPSLPLLRVDRPQPGDPATAAALAVIQALPEDLARRLSEVLAPSPETVSMRLKDGREVVWGGRDRPAAKAGILVTLLKRPADTYDVSSPDVVTVK